MMPSAMTRPSLLGAALGLILAGGAAGYWLAQRDAAPAPASQQQPKSERQVLYWYDPMAPDKHFDRPGKSPFMDMDLVPKYADEASAEASVRIDPALQQNVGVRTEVVEVGQLPTRLSVPGSLSWDLRREALVSTRVDAVVTRLQVQAPYTAVRQGQALATLLAPEWSSAIAEASALSQAQSGAGRELRTAAQQRLRTIGAAAGRRSADGSVTLTAPHNGVVSEVLAREGQAVAAGTPLFRINGTETVWLEAAVPQAEAGGLAPGMQVTARVTAVPGQVFRGVIETVIPQIESGSRTQQTRIVLNNPDGLLAPGMFAEVQLQPAAGANVPLVPSEALIATGVDSRLIVQGKSGQFRPVRVRTGRSDGDRTEILEGLKGGERVVVSGQFLIDSEASLSGALERLNATTTPAHDAHQEHLPSNAAGAATAPSKHDHAQATSAAPGPDAVNCPVDYWYDPMVPDQHFPRPGKSPYMDMQLAPKFARGADPACSGDVLLGRKPAEAQP